MSNSRLPVYVDTRTIFQQQGKLTGSVALERLPGFQQYLVDKSGEVEVELNFILNESSRKIISGSLSANVTLACQRCLEPVDIILQDRIQLALLSDEAELEYLEADLEPWVCEDKHLDLASVVEEQLILCLPIVSYHPEGDCQLGMVSTATGELAQEEMSKKAKNPFVVLQALKIDKTE